MFEWREDELIGYDEQNLNKVRKLGDLKKGRRRKAQVASWKVKEKD